jgi:quercetin dioxygenase-like cupin family protein
MQVTSFHNELEFDDHRVKTKLMIETSFSKEIRILMKKGQVMKEHQAPFPILIHVLSGKINLGVSGTAHSLKSDDIISLDANIPHNLDAEDDSIIRLTLSKQDKTERVQEVVNL